MNPSWTEEAQTDEGKTKEALTILQEECAEVIYISSKALRFGLDDIHPVTGIRNGKALAQEIGDVFALVDILLEYGVVSHGDISLSRIAKKEKLKKWSSLFA